jgi:hypothetical protein
MLDLGTLDQIRHYIKKQMDQTKEHLCYGVDTLDKLQYSRGKLNASRSIATGSKRPAEEHGECR